MFLSALLLFGLFGCNSTPDEVTLEETIVEVKDDTVPLVDEKVDSIPDKLEKEEEEDALDRSNLLDLYEVIETARLQNDFSTIKKYVKTDTFAFYYWPIKFRGGNDC